MNQQSYPPPPYGSYQPPLQPQPQIILDPYAPMPNQTVVIVQQPGMMNQNPVGRYPQTLDWYFMLYFYFIQIRNLD